MNENKLPIVSVIVPNYNYARYLKARIKSILDQTFQDFELILLDDCSTDNSREILESYRDNSHVSHIIFNEQNSGSPFVQWMKGISLAKGKYIWIAEADDLSAVTFLETSINKLIQNPRSIATVCGTILIDENGNQLAKRANYWDRRGMKKYQALECRTFNGRFFAIHKLFWSCCIQNTSATVFARENALKLAYSPFLSMRNSGDWLFWAQMVSQGEIIEIYSNLNFFRQHESKVTEKGKRSGKIIEEDIFVIKKMEEMYPEINQYQRRLCYGMLWRKIKRYPCDETEKERLRQLLLSSLDTTERDYQTLTLNRYLRYINPFLLTMERDRKKEQ